jgi:hypothetical protein
MRADKVTINLSFPVKIEGREIESVEMRRPKVKDALASDIPGKSDVEKEIIQFSNLCELPPEAFEQMDLKDYQAIQKVYSGFLS